MSRNSLLLLLSLLLPTKAMAGDITTYSNSFVDEFGRTRIFRGLNDCSNSPSQGESQGPFDGSNYLPRVLLSNDTRLDELVNSYGFNSFRVQAAWASVQPSPPVDGEFTFDTDYLDALEGLIEKLSSVGGERSDRRHKKRSNVKRSLCLLLLATTLVAAYSLLDMHRDGLSRNYGSYDGIPM